MKMNIRKRLLFLAGMMAVVSLITTGCSVDEDALFLEVESSVEVDYTVENTGMHEHDLTAYEEEVKKAKTDLTPEESIPESMPKEDSLIKVHVCGAVQIPGVYELEADSRMLDAVMAAGGFLPQADAEYVNLAAVLTDGIKVRIPTKEETTDMSLEEKEAGDNGVMLEQSQKNTGQSYLQKVNINTADKDLLCTLPGIGETRAESILAYRTEHGSFSKIEDIMLVSGIKESSFQKIKEYITIK